MSYGDPIIATLAAPSLERQRVTAVDATKEKPKARGLILIRVSHSFARGWGEGMACTVMEWKLQRACCNSRVGLISEML
jgi:hypothetical protein